MKWVIMTAASVGVYVAGLLLPDNFLRICGIILIVIMILRATSD